MNKIKLPRHKASLQITHNQHKDFYEDIEEYISNLALLDDDLMDDYGDILQKCIDNDSIWEMTWYPDTPIGSYKTFSDTFEGLFTEDIEYE